MKENKKATLQSQMGYEECMAEDTEEMFWLRHSDDYQSAVKLGDLLVSQYRFKEAIDIYEKAKRIKNDDKMLYIKLAGAYLTLFKFDEAEKNYVKARTNGAMENALAYPLGVLHYLKGEYKTATEYFSKCLPCNDELKIAVIYWHTLASCRCGISPVLLKQYDLKMSVGHHIAYKEVVSIFCDGSENVEIVPKKEELDNAILYYGLSVYFEYINLYEKAEKYLALTKECDLVWPCIPYLASISDTYIKKSVQ